MSYLPGHVRIAIFRETKAINTNDCLIQSYLKSGNRCICVSENSASINRNRNYCKAESMSEPFVHHSYFCMDY